MLCPLVIGTNKFGLKSLVIIVAMLLVGCQHENKSTEYVPLTWNGNEIVDSPNLLTQEHLNNVELVLRYYRIGFQRISPVKLIILNGTQLDRDTLWNFTSKANDNQWLSTHPINN
jgi:hypothetical protein